LLKITCVSAPFNILFLRIKYFFLTDYLQQIHYTMLEEKAKILFTGKAKNETELKSQTTKPHFAKPRGAPERAERNEFPSQNAMGGRFGRPRFRRKETEMFYTGAYILLCSHSFYQKFVKKPAPPPLWRGRGKNKTQKFARGQKISSPKNPPFFATSPKIFYHFLPNFLKLLLKNG